MEDTTFNKFKVIAEYERYFIAQHPKGYKECFDKIFYEADEKNNIRKRKKVDIFCFKVKKNM